VAPRRARRPHRRFAAIGALAFLAVALAGSASFQTAASSSAFADGFETGTLEGWNDVEGLVAVEGAAYEGSWSAQAATDAGASFATALLAAPADAGTARLAFAVHDLTTRATLLKLRTADGSSITVGLNLRHQIFAYMPSSELVVDETHQVTEDVWHWLEVAFVTGDDARAQISVDGVPVKEVSAANGSGPVTRLAIGTRRGGRTFDVRFDDVSLISEAGQDPDPSPDPGPDPGPSGSVVAAAGDIACDPADPAFNGGLGTNRACRMADTAELLSDADIVMPLGDIQYEDGALELYADSYGPTWGEWLPITRPVVGNHEYEQPDAEAYFSYFGAAAGTPG
jgi:hypothetical protein